MLETKRSNGAITPFKRNLNPLLSFKNDFNNFFENALARPLFSDLSTMNYMSLDFSPNLDVKETEKDYKVEAELPGVKEGNIDLSIENNCLIMKGEKKEQKKEEGESYYHIERKFGGFYRSIPFSTEIDDEKVSATYKNGILSVAVAKSDKGGSSKRKIPIQTN